MVDLRLLCVSEWILHWFTQYIRHCLHFNQNKVSKRAVCWPYRYERGGGVNIILFISGSHLRTCVYADTVHVLKSLDVTSSLSCKWTQKRKKKKQRTVTKRSRGVQHVMWWYLVCSGDPVCFRAWVSMQNLSRLGPYYTLSKSVMWIYTNPTYNNESREMELSWIVIAHPSSAVEQS